MSGYWEVGGLVGENWGGTVSNCYSTGTVSGRAFVGGLVGVNNVTVSNCYSTGTVSAGTTGSVVSGLIGLNYGTVSNCYSTGSISANYKLGGLVGYNSGGMVVGCYSTGTVSGTDSYVGGLVGENDGTVTQSYSTGAVSGSGVVGGLVGLNGGTVSNSYWDIETSGQSTSDGGTGKTTAEMKQQATYVGWDFVSVWRIKENITYPCLRWQLIKIYSIEELQRIGNDAYYPLDGKYELAQDIDASDTINWDGGAGFNPIGTDIKPFIGKFDGKSHKIIGLYIYRQTQQNVGLFGVIGIEGEVSRVSIENCRILGHMRVGSLVGKNVGGSVRHCYSTGEVSGDTEVGGLVGGNFNNVIQCFSTVDVDGVTAVGGLIGSITGSVSLSYSMGSVTGINNIGGLVGGIDTGIVSYCYSTGLVSGSSNIGGLAGFNGSGTVSNSYWDVETSGRNSSAGGIGKTTAEMKQQATFVGWDFVNVWWMQENETYPLLKKLLLPEITILGDNPVTKECGSTYLDVGATANDVPDGDLTGQIQVVNDVDSSTPGEYTVTYTVTDSDNNTVVVVRTVRVVDTTAPEILLNGANPMIVECHTSFTDPGASAVDACDGPVDVEVTGSVNVNTAGEYILTYTAKDSLDHTIQVQRRVQVVDTFAPSLWLIGSDSLIWECGEVFIDPGAGAVDVCDGPVDEYVLTYTAEDNSSNIAELQRTVHVVDTSAPDIELNGSDVMVVECHTSFVDPGASAIDACEGSVNVEVSGRVDVITVGEYVLTYIAEDSSSNRSQIRRRVNVVDTTAPEIVLFGANPMIVECRTPFIDPGADAGDACEGSVNVEVTGSVNVDAAGEYVLTYTAKDSLNHIKQVQRTVRVEDTTAPEIILNGGNPLIWECNTPFRDPGATASDLCDNRAFVRIISNDVDVTQSGTYHVVYEALDARGNRTEVVRGVIVECPEEGEGTAEGTPEGVEEGEGTAEGTSEGIVEGEGSIEGSEEGEVLLHSADQNGDGQINLSELLRVIQFFNFNGYHCALPGEVSEDGYLPGIEGDKSCRPHASDYNSQDWVISLSELLRLIQFSNMGGYYPCPDNPESEDNYCPGQP